MEKVVPTKEDIREVDSMKNVRGWVWRLLILIELVIFAGIIKSCAQTQYRLDVDYTRIGINNHDRPVSDTLRTLFVIGDKCLGIVTLYDTLALIYLTRDGNFLLFVDVYHKDGQEYILEKHVWKDRFLWIVTPLKPYSRRKVYSLIFESL